MPTETYVITIYRRSSEAGKEVTGLAERTGSGQQKAFSSSEELWAFLSCNPTSRTQKPKKNEMRRSKN